MFCVRGFSEGGAAVCSCISRTRRRRAWWPIMAPATILWYLCTIGLARVRVVVQKRQNVAWPFVVLALACIHEEHADGAPSDPPNQMSAARSLFLVI
jgi:hypothetical protein